MNMYLKRKKKFSIVAHLARMGTAEWIALIMGVWLLGVICGKIVGKIAGG